MNNLRTVVLVSVGLNLFMFGYFAAHLPIFDRFDGPPPFMDHTDRPPPIFLFHDALSADRMHDHFVQRRAIRQVLIDKLASGAPVTKADLTRYYDGAHRESKAFRDDAETAATQRILDMSKEERVAFSQILAEEDRQHEAKF